MKFLSFLRNTQYKCNCGNNLIEKPTKDYPLSSLCDNCLIEILKKQWKEGINSLSDKEFKRIKKIGKDFGVEITRK